MAMKVVAKFRSQFIIFLQSDRAFGSGECFKRVQELRAKVGTRSSEHNRVKNNNGGNNGTLLHDVVKPGAACVLRYNARVYK